MSASKTGVPLADFRLVKQCHQRVCSRPRRWRYIFLRPAVAMQIIRGGSVDQSSETMTDELNRLGIICAKSSLTSLSQSPSLDHQFVALVFRSIHRRTRHKDQSQATILAVTPLARSCAAKSVAPTGTPIAVCINQFPPKWESSHASKRWSVGWDQLNGKFGCENSAVICQELRWRRQCSQNAADLVRTLAYDLFGNDYRRNRKRALSQDGINISIEAICHYIYPYSPSTTSISITARIYASNSR